MQLVSATIATTPDLRVVAHTPLFPVTGFATSTPHSNYDVAPDGRTFGFVSFNQASRVMIIQNLPALVERLRGGIGGTR